MLAMLHSASNALLDPYLARQGQSAAAFRPRRPQRLGMYSLRGACTRCHVADDDDEAAPATSDLSATIKRKYQQLQSRIEELGEESLQEQLQMVVDSQEQRLRSNIPDFQLTRLISETRECYGRPIIIVEVTRSSSVATSQQLALAAAATLAAGADAITVPMDAEATSSGLSDLFAVCNAVKAPVLARDWFLHPLQIVDAREAGAAGVLGVLHQVTADGSAVLSSFAAAVGLEAPVEIVNKEESDKVETLGVPFVAINVAIGLSLSMPSIASQIADALVKDQPFGNLSLVGIRTFEDARRAQLAGADALFLRADFVDANLEAARASGLSGLWSEEKNDSKEHVVLQYLIDTLNDDL